MKVARKSVVEKHREDGVKEIYEPAAIPLTAYSDECVVINDEAPLMRRRYNRSVCGMKSKITKGRIRNHHFR